MFESPSVSVDVRATAWKVFCILGAIAIALTLASYTGQLLRFVAGRDHVMGLIDFFDVDNENSIATVFSSLQLFIAAGILFGICALKITGPSPWAWRILTLGFTVMGVDELISLHEQMFLAVDRRAEGIPLYERAWVYPAIPIVALLAFCFIPFLRGLPRGIRNGMIFSGLLFIAGAIVVEALEIAFVVNRNFQRGLAFNTMTTLEEAMEMLGITCFIYTLLRYVALHYPTIALEPRITSAATGGGATPLPSDTRKRSAAS
ncbi:MAG: hypothetical protein ACO1Q7_15985 [Gemmatimonas sp.]